MLEENQKKWVPCTKRKILKIINTFYDALLRSLYGRASEEGTQVKLIGGIMGALCGLHSILLGAFACGGIYLSL